MNKLELHKAYDFSSSDHPAFTAVFIHGIAANWQSYEHALAFFEKDEKINARLVAFDLLGAGDSLKSDELEYTYDEQLEAIKNSIKAAKIKTPFVLVGHSMGTFISARFASKNPDMVKRLILVSPPVYTKEDLANPAFAAAIKVFEDAVSVKDKTIVNEKSFQNSMKNIVMDPKNYDVLVGLDLPIDMIIGDLDKFIASYNLPRIKHTNHNIKVHHTPSHHGVSHEKYYIMAKLLEEETNEAL